VTGRAWLMLTLYTLAGFAHADEPAGGVEAALGRARVYLAREVPRWERANGCFSCHHDGDGTRALVALAPRGAAFPPELARTRDWLRDPDSWDRGEAESPFRDARLGRLQFAAALADLTGAGWVNSAGPLRRAAARLAADQDADGSWPIEGAGFLPGGPTTLGRALVTAEALRVLRQTDEDVYRSEILRGQGWLARLEPRSMPERYAVAIGLPPEHPAAARARGRIRDAQGRDGAWGPFPDAPPEVFDTALGVLALAGAFPEAAARGRAWLLGQQGEDGAWAETTRPSGGESEAQRLSTTAWAARALLSGRKPAPGSTPSRPGSSR
jgi:hypothetical protein